MSHGTTHRVVPRHIGGSGGGTADSDREDQGAEEFPSRRSVRRDGIETGGVRTVVRVEPITLRTSPRRTWLCRTPVRHDQVQARGL